MNQLIILGASARAAAYSALRAGFQPWCIDLFADCDLSAIAPAIQLNADEYPHGFVRIVAESAPNAPIIYTGGLENHPQVYLELAKLRPVWGYLHPEPFTASDSIRNPFALSRCCANAGLARPMSVNVDAASCRVAAETRLEAASTLPIDGTWLCKPLSGAGGKAIAYWHGQPLSQPEKYYFQQFQAGTPLAAVYVNVGDRTHFVGLTRQIIGASFLHATSPFSYCGTIGPLFCLKGTPLHEQCVKTGETLARFDPCLRGLFGVDLIWDGERAYVIEVNPRYTASVEILELSNPTPVSLALHAQAFRPDSVEQTFLSVGPDRNVRPNKLGKAIYFAPQRLVFPDCGPWDVNLTFDPERIPGYADIPTVGSVIEKEQPVLTFFESGLDESAVEKQLQQIAMELDERFQMCDNLV